MDAELIAVFQGYRSNDPLPIQVGAVTAAEIGHEVGRVFEGNLGMAAGNELIPDLDVTVFFPPDDDGFLFEKALKRFSIRTLPGQVGLQRDRLAGI